MSIARCVHDMVGGRVSNLISGDRALECQLAFSCANEGSEVVLDKNQDPDGKVEEILIKQYGLHVLESLDDGMMVLALHTDVVVSSNSVTVDAVLEPADEESSTSNHRGAAKDVLPDSKWIWQPDVKVGLEPVSLEIHERNQKLFADTWFRRSYCREDESNTFYARLVVDETTIGVEKCFTNKDKDKRGYFIYEMTVTATPCETWKEKCRRISARPSPKGSDVLNEQTSLCGFTAAVSTTNPLGVTTQRSFKRTTCTKDFDWLSCKVLRNAVTWTWQMQSWEGGASFQPDQGFRMSCGALPRLPFDPESFSQDSTAFVADAYWEVPDMSQDLTDIAWSIEIQLHYAFLERPFNIGNVLSVRKAIKGNHRILSLVKLL